MALELDGNVNNLNQEFFNSEIIGQSKTADGYVIFMLVLN